MLRDRAQAVVPGEPAAERGLQPALLEVDVVVDDEHRLRRRLEEPRGGADRAARLVHVRLGLEEREPRAVEPHLRELAGELRAPRAAVPAARARRRPSSRRCGGSRAYSRPGLPRPATSRSSVEARSPRRNRRHGLALGGRPDSPAASASARRSRQRPPAPPRPPRPRPRRPPRPPRRPRPRAPRPASAPSRSRAPSPGSSRKVTPSGVGRSDRRSVSPISIALTSSSMRSGISSGSASTRISRVTCESTPPAFDAGGLADELDDHAASGSAGRAAPPGGRSARSSRGSGRPGSP